MKAVLRYRDTRVAHKNDATVVYSVLAKHNAKVLKTKTLFRPKNPKVLIFVDSLQTLNKIVAEINEKSIHGVPVVKTYKK